MDVDSSMKKILDFIQNRELRSEESAADQLAQLSSLLKSSSAQHSSNQIEIGDGDKELTDAINESKPKNNNESTKTSREIKKSSTINPTNVSVEKKSKNLNQNSNLKSNLGTKKFSSVKTAKQVGKSTKPSTQNKVKLLLTENKEQKTKISRKELNVEEFKENEEKTSIAVKDMQSVRQHLQSMLNIHKVVVKKAPLLEESDGNISFGKMDAVEENNENVDTFDSSNTATLLRANPRGDFMSPVKNLTTDLCAESLSNDLFSLIKTGTNKASTPQSAGNSLIDNSMVTQNEILRDTLEKENFRRQHCEKQIQKLQKKILKVQQELAVCHSTDRKKDLMIEQLDVTLAKVVDGWKTHEESLVNSLEEYKQERENNKLEIIKLKEMLVGFESELAQTLEELILEREKVVQAENNEKKMQSNYQARTEEISQVINQKNSAIEDLESKLDVAALESNEVQQKLNDHIRESAEDKRRFIGKEEEWEEIIIELEKNHKQEIQQNKQLIANEQKRCEEMKSNLTSSQEEFVRLQELLKAQQHQLENVQNEINVNEARQTSNIRKLEAEHKIAIERQITEKLSKVHSEAQKSEANVREMHKKQVAEIMEGHRRELESQCRRYEDEMMRREEVLKKSLEEREKGLNDRMKEKSEEMRQKMMSMMQNLMQAHYHETLQVVGNTTGLSPDMIAQENQMVKTLTNADDTSIMDFQQANMISSVRTQSGGQSFLPYNTMTSQVSQLQGSDLMPRQSLFQPQMSNSVVTSLPQFGAIGLTRAVESHVTTDEDVLPNLSLISSISHSTVSSMPQVYKHVNEPHFAPVPPVMGGHVSSVGLSFQQQQKQQQHQQTGFELSPMTSAMQQVENANQNNTLQSIDTPHDVSDPQIRNNTLQHYVSMLLQRPPNQPIAEQLNTPKQISGSIENQENQNNSSKDLLARLLTAQNQASPDMFPTKQNRDFNNRSAFNQVTASNSVPQMQNKQVKKPPKQNVRFASNILDQSSTTPVSNQPPMLSRTQMGEISRILGSYASLDTPSGDTKVAAEQLLNYLKDSKSEHSIKVPAVTPVTSSPVKRHRKQDPDSSILHISSLSQSGGQKSSTNTSKGPPAWR